MAHCKGSIPTRATIAVMLFSACFVSYMVRVNMSINIIAMVEPTKSSNGENAVAECTINHHNNTIEGILGHLTTSPDYGTRFEWDTKLQGLVLGAFFWGFTITSLPGGLLAERCGPTKVVMISSLFAGALTLLGPVASSWHYIALIITRFLTGLCGGVIYPSLHCLVSRWAPPEEKGLFIGSLLGGTLGTVVTWPLLGAIIETWGWSWSFFVNGGIILVWCIFWILLVADSPEQHPRISEEEKRFIQESLGNVVKRNKGLPPYKNIFLSVPFWALCILHYGNLWGLFFLMTAGPNFMSSVLGFNLGHTGVLAALPHLARLILGIFFGFVGDFIRKRQLMSTNSVRKSFVFFSHIIPGILLFVLNITGCHVMWSVALMTLSLGSNGASTLTNLQNSQDLAPNFAGTLYGVINCIGSTTGFINPIIVGYITSKKNGLHEWHQIFCIGGAVYIVCGLVFCLFGTADVQEWNEVPEKNKLGVENAAFDSSSDVTVKVADSHEENTKI